MSSQSTTDDRYHPTDEYEELEDSGEIYGWGAGRRKTIDALEQKPRLKTIQTFDSREELLDAVREISLAHRDGTIYRGIPKEVTQTLKRTYEQLPEEAQSKYLNDDIIHRRVNAARNSFNQWMAKKKREKEMPSPAEAGPSKYPADKARRRSESAYNASTDLDERLKRIKSAARGARGRALEAIGSSVAEQNQKKKESLMERRREEWEPGDIVVYRSPNLHAAAIVRLNKKSVRVQRKNPHQDSDWGTDGEYMRETVDLDSNHITRYEPEDIPEIEDSALDRSQTVPDTLVECQRQMLGEEWVEENRDIEDEELTPTSERWEEAVKTLREQYEASQEGLSQFVEDLIEHLEGSGDDIHVNQAIGTALIRHREIPPVHVWVGFESGSTLGPEKVDRLRTATVELVLE